MNRFLIAGIALASIAAPVVAQRPSDAAIKDHVSTSLLVDPRIASADVNIDVANGFATLSGRVGSLAAREFADREVEKIAGVKGVTDELEVDAPWRSDVDIVQDVRHRLVDHSRISTFGVGVRCKDGDVTLTGEVPAYVEKRLATELASEVPGVRKVTNDMTVNYAWTRADKDIEKDVRAALDLDVYLTGLPVQARVEDGKVILDGTVGSWYVRRRAEENVRWLPGVRGVTNNLKVEWYENRGERQGAPAVSDENLAENVRHQLMHDTRIVASDLHVTALAGDVTVSGSVPSAYQKDIVLDDARNTVGVVEVGDRVRVRSAWRADSAVRMDVLRELQTDYLLWDAGLGVKVKNGDVTLDGRLSSEDQRRHAVAVARRVRGVRHVIDDIDVVTEARSDASIASSISSRLLWDWSTSPVGKEIRAEVSDGTVTLTGEVNTWAEREAAGRIANETPGVWRVFNHIHVKGYPTDWGF